MVLSVGFKSKHVRWDFSYRQLNWEIWTAVLFCLFWTTSNLEGGKLTLLEKQNHPWSGASTLGKVRAPCWGASLHSGHGTSSPFGFGLSGAQVESELCWISPWNGLTKLVLPRGRAVLTVKQVSNEDEFHQLWAAVTHQDWELWGLVIQSYK